jgi:hypothetical protein
MHPVNTTLPVGTGSRGTPAVPGAAQGRPARAGRFWPRAAPVLGRHVILMTPWVTLFAGCAAGTALLALLAVTSHTPLGQTAVRITFLPAVATLAFVPHAPLRPLAQSTPLPAWVTPVAQSLLAAPVLALTCWVQLLVMAHTYPSPGRHHLAAVYPLIAQLTAWSALAVAAAACCDRSRYYDLAGAIAAPVTLAAIAFAWFAPEVKGLLTIDPANPRNATIAWYGIAAASLAIAAAAMSDTWHRYTRKRW